MNDITLEYDGAEHWLVDWGMTEPMMHPRKLAVTTFTVRIPGASNLVAAPPIPFKGQVIIRRHRVEAEDHSFSGGEIIFQGRQITDHRMASRSPAEVLTFGNAWWDLENLPFQQQWVYWDGAAASRPFCQVNLFQSFETGFVITNGAQIAEIVGWAAACGVQLQAGTIDLDWYVQPYPASAVSCASAIQICMKPTPGAALWIDMSTTPPTLNCQNRYYHAALSLPYASDNHRSSELTPRYDLQVPQVVIQYRKGVRVTSGGATKTWTDFPYDAWPLDATLDAGVRGGKQVGAMVVPIQLADYQRTDLVQKVVAGAFGSPPSLDWWKSKKAAMASYTDLVFVPGSLKILDSTGADITATVLADFPNELVDGNVAGWMKDDGGTAIGAERVTVQGKFTYVEKDEQGRTVHVVLANPHVISVNTRLTNSAVGEQSYWVTQSLDSGQEPVANLAQNIWTLLSWLFWDGTHSIVERNAEGAPEVTTIVDCRYALNLTGGAAAWAGMLSPVHGADIDFTHGTTDIRFGVPPHVGPSDLEQLCQFFKFRRVLNNTNLQSSGNTAADSAEVGGQTARENTSNSHAVPSLHTTSADVSEGVTTHLQLDATGKEFRLQVVDADDELVGGNPSVSLKLSDLQYA